MKDGKVWVGQAAREQGREGRLRHSTGVGQAEVPMSSQLASPREQKAVILVVPHTGERAPVWATGILLALAPILLAHIIAHSFDCHPPLLSIPEGWGHKKSRQEKECRRLMVCTFI